MKHNRQSMRDQDIQKIADDSIAEYKESYEDTLRRLIIGKTCPDEYDDCHGPLADATQFYVDLLIPENETSLSKRYVKRIR